jgi:GT2 family glycosyltransferase
MTHTTCVIVPSVNNPEELSIALDGLLLQDKKIDEIVVVGPSNDPGRLIAEKKNIRFIDDKGSKNRADACNVAIESTTSDIILFTDDDVIVPKTWAGSILKWYSREEVAGVGGPNFAPVQESTFWQKVIDVTFCSTIFTSGTNYGKVGINELEEVDQLPGVNSSYRRKVIEEAGGFDKGSIGAEDVILDYRVRMNGNKLWTDKNAIMWHRRRNISRVKKQIRNYGLVRALASNQYSELKSPMHVAVALFPLLVISSFLFFFWGIANEGLAWPEFWDIRLSTVPMGSSRIGVHTLPTLIILYNILAWYGSWKGQSPSKSKATIFFSPMVSYILHWNYGIGILNGWYRILIGNPGLQVDDKIR